MYSQGRALGGARFRRLEGAWWGRKTGYFLSTDGGQVREGQVFEYDPRSDRITLLYDSPSATETENPDNIVVTPRRGLLLCEDNSGSTANDAERLLGLDFDGHVYEFAKNNIVLSSAVNDQPWAWCVTLVETVCAIVSEAWNTQDYLTATRVVRQRGILGRSRRELELSWTRRLSFARAGSRRSRSAAV